MGMDPEASHRDVGRAVEDVRCAAQPWFTVGKGAVAAVVALGGLGVVVNPLWTKAEEARAEETQAKVDHQQNIRILENAQAIIELRGNVQMINKNGAKTLRSSLMRDVRDLREQIQMQQPGTPTRRSLERQLDQAESDLADVQEQLGTDK